MYLYLIIYQDFSTKLFNWTFLALLLGFIFYHLFKIFFYLLLILLSKFCII